MSASPATRTERRWPAKSSSARRARFRTSGRESFRTRSPPMPRAGCASAPVPARAVPSCHSSSPTTRTGPTSSAPSARPDARELWVTHGQEEALVHWAQSEGLAARPAPHGRLRRGGGSGGMNRFAELLDRLAYEPRRNAKLRLLSRLFPRHARSRSRLGPRGDHRGALLPQRQARPDPRPRSPSAPTPSCSGCPTTMSATSLRPSR